MKVFNVSTDEAESFGTQYRKAQLLEMQIEIELHKYSLHYCRQQKGFIWKECGVEFFFTTVLSK